MDKLRLIIAREYMSIVGRKSFIILTLLLPFLIIAVASVPMLIAMMNESGSEDQIQHIAVIDETGKYGSSLTSDKMYNFEVVNGYNADNAREYYEDSKDIISAYIIIPRDVETSAQVNIYSENTITPALVSMVNHALTDTIQNALLESKGIPNLKKILDETSVNLDVRNVILQEDGNEKESSTGAAMGLGMALAFIIYMFVIICGSMIMNNVIEEKTNRIVEVVVSSCRPFHLMLGKIIGVGLSGLTQIGVWIIMFIIAGALAGNVFGMSGTATPDMMGAGAAAAPEVENFANDAIRQMLSINYLPIIVNFLLYFIGGYLLYGALFAALASAVDQASDTSQFMWPVIMIILIAMYAAMGCAENPNGPMAFWCSMIPFTSPIVMMIRLPYDVPIWQMVLSHVLLFGTALLIIWCAGRIYRRGILHYGQKASFKDLFKWLK